MYALTPFVLRTVQRITKSRPRRQLLYFSNIYIALLRGSYRRQFTQINSERGNTKQSGTPRFLTRALTLSSRGRLLAAVALRTRFRTESTYANQRLARVRHGALTQYIYIYNISSLRKFNFNLAS